jgi:hypothetical protein
VTPLRQFRCQFIRAAGCFLGREGMGPFRMCRKSEIDLATSLVRIQPDKSVSWTCYAAIGQLPIRKF